METPEPTQEFVEQVKTTEKERTKDSWIHALIVLCVLFSATALRIKGDLDTATVSTVYGAILGYATALTNNRQRNGYAK